MNRIAIVTGCVLSGAGLVAATYYSVMENKKQMRNMDLVLSTAEVQHFERDGQQFYYDPLHGRGYQIGGTESKS